MDFDKLKKTFLDIISFNTPKTIVFNLSTILILLAAIPTETLTKYSPFRCVFKHFLFPLLFNGSCPSDGIFASCNCPACGMTRGMSRLLHGDVEGAMSYNRLVVLVFVVIVLVIGYNVYLIVKKKKK